MVTASFRGSIAVTRCCLIAPVRSPVFNEQLFHNSSECHRSSESRASKDTSSESRDNLIASAPQFSAEHPLSSHCGRLHPRALVGDRCQPGGV